MVVTILRLVSPNVPSKSNIISPLLILIVGNRTADMLLLQILFRYSNVFHIGFIKYFLMLPDKGDESIANTLYVLLPSLGNRID